MGGRPVFQPTWKTRGVQDFVLACIPKPFFGALIDCGVLAFPVEVKKRILWPHYMSGGAGGWVGVAGGVGNVLLKAVLMRDSR